MLVMEHFDRAVRRFPDRPLVISRDGDLTHREMAERVALVANAIVRQGLGADTKIALLTPNHPLGMMCEYAISKAGCVWVPCNWRNPVLDTVRQVAALDVHWLFYHSSLEDYAVAVRNAVPGLAGITPFDRPTPSGSTALDWAAGFAPGAALPERTMDDAVSIISSGGTTGVPKGLRASHNCGTKCHVPSLEEGVETAETPGDGFRAGWLVAA